MNAEFSIAVVSMAGLFPGAADLQSYWQNILNGVDAIADVPSGRWAVNPEGIYDPDGAPDKVISRRAGLVAAFNFDPAGFEVPADLLRGLDPLYHMVLHVGRQAIAPFEGQAFNRRRTGVILAAIALPTDTASRITAGVLGPVVEQTLFADGRHPASLPPFEAFDRRQYFAGQVTGLPAGLLARALGLGGSSFTLDAACASSLFAVKLACDELAAHRADAMLAGGVSRPDCLFTQVGFSQLKALSPSGRCAPFDHRADGLVVGEGAGLVVLKRLEDALAHGDRVLAVIRAAGLSNDMRGNLLAPDSEGQLRAMRRAYASCQWSPADIDLIECHGAGTPVGDRTELRSLQQLWGPDGWAPEQCVIGSVKSMIGHLLTAAGAAGMIKTILALQHNILPPSLNFTRAPHDSPLPDSPFRVASRAEEWPSPPGVRPRRAAVSAFGFGGINAHILLEQWNSQSAKRIAHSGLQQSISSCSPPPTSGFRLPTSDIAIVGMDAAFGGLAGLQDFQHLVFGGRSAIKKRPAQRWKGCEPLAGRYLQPESVQGAFLDAVAVTAGEFHIPPSEIPDILPQHLLMLKIAAAAMDNAGLDRRQERPQMGAVIAIDFDHEAANFHLRWQVQEMLPRWLQRLGLDPRDEQTASLVRSVLDACSPPLTATRTLGALGGIVASRVAREFCFGAASFVVSCEAAAGLKALEIGVRALQQKEAEAYLIGAVDLCGDVRQALLSNGLRPFSNNGKIAPFDRQGDGFLPGEGAAALVIKPLEKAVADGNRIYAVIKGIGAAGGGDIHAGAPSTTAYLESLQHCCREAGMAPENISFVEAHGSGHPSEDLLEAEALNAFFKDRRRPCAIGSAKPAIGHTGAASSLASVVKTALCLYHEILPPLTGFSIPASALWQSERFHFPRWPQYWTRNRQDGPRRALVASMTPDGNCMHAALQGYDYPGQQENSPQLSAAVEQERKRPLGFYPGALFVVEADSTAQLDSGLDTLARFAATGRPADSAHIEAVARDWFRQNGIDPGKARAVAIVAQDKDDLLNRIRQARTAAAANTPRMLPESGAVHFAPRPLGPGGRLAFVFPGSGNHYLGMGRQLATCWPEILRRMDAETRQLETQLLPDCYVPRRLSWEPGWQKAAYEKIVSNPLHMIFGQVVHGSVVAWLMKHFAVVPSAVIGYSLGESAGYFAMGAWPERGRMLERMQKTDLFTTQLAGPCHSARRAWQLSPDEEVAWRAAVVNRPAGDVRRVVSAYPGARLLIVNTPDECVIGGRRREVAAAIKDLGCEAIYLDGVVTVHCDALQPVADAYRRLHLFDTRQPEGIQFYSCALGRAYDLNREAAADSIVSQALHGFDFTATVEQAYADGVRLFVEMGPASSCTRMIDRILQHRPHLALSACVRGEDDPLTILKVLGALVAERVPVDLQKLYGPSAYAPESLAIPEDKPAGSIRLTVGGGASVFSLSSASSDRPRPVVRQQPSPEQPAASARPAASDAGGAFAHLIATADRLSRSTTAAHQKFLDLSRDLSRSYAETLNLQTRLLARSLKDGAVFPAPGAQPAATPSPAYSRQDCLEFARGSVARVLGPEFAEVDTYPVRVRLPDEPLMLVDRILSVEGRKGSLEPGRIVTEHDVLAGAWYLDGGHAPVCIAVEAGQADLFLCSFLGIDREVKGQRAYRLLDATVEFHRHLPVAGETIRYEIQIEKFFRQGETHLFLFNFKGFIGDTPLITMTNGCAGFFTAREVRNSGGIILSETDTAPVDGKKPADWKNLVPQQAEKYTDAQIEVLRRGELALCFGEAFEGVTLADSLKLPGGRMKLIDRVLELQPAGGRYGLGLIRAEADVHPDDWFLTCHFVDDRVMPGTLMYECCAHSLRVFLQRLGWVTPKAGVCYEPVIGVKSIMKCRGPVTPDTRKVVYEIQIRELGYAPQPYAIADAHMVADGHHIVWFKDMSLQMSGITREEIEAFWQQKSKPSRTPAAPQRRRNAFDRRHLLEFATGSPSKAFGEAYRPFDERRFIARLPAPPYLCIDRITHVEPAAWKLEPDGWIQAEYDVVPDAWYFKADRTPAVPISIILEIALQPCGWLAAYMGSALKSQQDLRFRNLGGKAQLTAELLPDCGTLTTRARLTRASEAGDMIIEHFDFEVWQQDQKRYAGTTYFGFFTAASLAQQQGLGDADKPVYPPAGDALKTGRSYELADDPPLFPGDTAPDTAPAMAMPARALRMIDRIETWIPEGGPAGLGFIRGTKTVDPRQWFFKAHFHQDPVWPGSLGIESFIQLLKFMAGQRWPELADSHRFALATPAAHSWIYRGQIVPANKMVTVEAVVTRLVEHPLPTILADGHLMVDGLYIYKMENFGLQLVPAK